MVSSEERYVVGLDVGTSKVAAIVGEARDDGSLDVIGVGWPTRAASARRRRQPRGGGRVDQEGARGGELTAGIEIDAVHLGLSGAHMNGVNSRGVVAVAGKNKEIMREDVRRALDAAKA
jgi:cell division protein FtsA